MAVFKNDKGKSGESISASHLALIFNGETIKETLSGEGEGALDWQLNYKKFYGVNSVRRVCVQVKTGNSYTRRNKLRKCWSIKNIDSEHIDKWKANRLTVLLIWIKPDDVTLYWKLFGNKSSSFNNFIYDKHKLTPASKFEIDRLVHFNYLPRTKIPKLTLRLYDSLSDCREALKKRITEIRETIPTEFGNVVIGNYAVRHLTRLGRNKSHIKESLLLLPFVKQFLNSVPHQIQTIYNSSEKIGKRNLVKSKVLLIYRDVNFNDIPNAVVYVRLDETIIYDEDWILGSVNGKPVIHQLRLESVYRKTKT